MAWYKTGTVAVTNGSTAVVGTGTNWFGAMESDWAFVGPDGRVYEIQSVTSDTQLTLATTYQGAGASAQTYAAYPTRSQEAAVAAQLAALISGFQGAKDLLDGSYFGQALAAFNSDRDTGVELVGENEIGLKAGDVLQLALAGGKARGEAVQSVSTDVETLERIVNVGGARAAASRNYGGYYSAGSGVNIDTVSAGFVGLVSDSNAGTWPLAPFGGFVWVDTQAIYAGEAVLQRAVYGYGGTAPSVPKVFYRIKANSGGAWTGWVREMTDADGVLTTGAGGLLGYGQVISDFSTVPSYSQFIAGGGAGVTADAPPNGGAYKPGIVAYRSSSSRASVLMFTTNGIAVRNYTDGVPDGDWNELAPERDSNANGEYVKLPDGTLICTHSLALTGGGNITISGAWVFPYPFIAKPKVSAVSEAAPPAGTRERSYWFGGSATGVNVNASMNANWPANTSEVHSVTAIGRWK